MSQDNNANHPATYSSAKNLYNTPHSPAICDISSHVTVRLMPFCLSLAVSASLLSLGRVTMFHLLNSFALWHLHLYLVGAQSFITTSLIFGTWDVQLSVITADATAQHTSKITITWKTPAFLATSKPMIERQLSMAPLPLESPSSIPHVAPHHTNRIT